MKINLKDMIELLAHNTPENVYNELIRIDEDFREFINDNKNKSTEEMIECYHINERIREMTSHA